VATEIRRATPADIEYISAHLRERDKAEIWASHRRRPEELPQVCSQVEVYAWVVDDVPVVMFGCNDEGVGVPWLLATDAINFHSVAFLRQARRICWDWLIQYRTLVNYVHADNEQCILWLISLGFAFPESAMINGQKFLRFEKRWQYV
jgi:hypothetical protein